MASPSGDRQCLMQDHDTPPNDTGAQLRARYLELRRENDGDPINNSALSLASELFLGLERGEMKTARLREAAARFELRTFETRARRFRGKIREAAALPAPSCLDAKNFDAFASEVERCSAGVVFTAHPTFALTEERRAYLARYPFEGAPDDLEAWRGRVAAAPAGPPPGVTLDYEHRETRKAIAEAQRAIRKLNASLIDEARRAFPDKWRALTPQPISLATWVGYDLDGRTDIHWGQSIRIRLEEKAAQLSRYVEQLQDCIALSAEPRLEEMRARFAKAAAATARHAALFAGDLDDPATVVEAANTLTEERDGRLVSLSDDLKIIDAVSAAVESDETATALRLLRAEMTAYGLGVARIHLRVNAAQVRSALRADLGLDPDRDFAGRSALAVASDKAKAAKLNKVNFGSLFLERMTARRQFMMCAQILKHIDADTPIRFLIAECEAPATIMGAVYLARLYGVADKVDISPLFETPEALEGGGRFIERLLDNEEYRAYVERRGRMSVQIGYSDSGRFMGQITASLAAERLQVLFAKALGAAGLEGVEALVFNTHGESMGRGAHPDGYPERLDHLAPPWVHSRFRREGAHFNCEYSFQGGDGFLYFQTEECADATIHALWSSICAGRAAPAPDRFYDDINYSWDFYRALKTWQETLYDHPDYRRALFAFPQAFLAQTGSRKSKRPERAAGPPQIRAMRAIPHNSILQQLAFPINVVGGVGAAGGREPDRFVAHVAGSRRMRELTAMAAHARALSSVSILRAYAGIVSPAYWSSLAGISERREDWEVYETTLEALRQKDIASSLSRLADFAARDLRSFDALQADIGLGDDDDDPEDRAALLGALHAARLALFARALSLTSRAPAFSRRHDIDRGDLVNLAIDLQLSAVVDALRMIFPKETPGENLMAGLAEDMERSDETSGAYPEVHRAVIEPLEEIAETMELIKAAIANLYGAYG